MLKYHFMEHHLYFSRPSQQSITLPVSGGGMVVVVNLWRHTGLSLPFLLCLKLFTALPLPWPMVNSLDTQDLSGSMNYHGSEQRFKRRSTGWRWGRVIFRTVESHSPLPLLQVPTLPKDPHSGISVPCVVQKARIEAQRWPVLELVPSLEIPSDVVIIENCYWKSRVLTSWGFS